MTITSKVWPTEAMHKFHHRVLRAHLDLARTAPTATRRRTQTARAAEVRAFLAAFGGCTSTCPDTEA